MKKTLFLLFITLVISLSSCKKNSTPPMLVFGQPSKMKIAEINPPMVVESWADGGEVADSIDVNNDGIYDFEFTCYGQKWASTESGSIKSLNPDFSIACNKIIDTIFETHHNQNPDVPYDWVSYNSYSGFNSYDDNDSVVLTREVYYPISFARGDTINLTSSDLLWHQEGEMGAYERGFYYTSEDLYLYFQQDFLVGQTNKYMCFQLVKKNRTRYGWIKFSYENYLKVSTFQIAINE